MKFTKEEKRSIYKNIFILCGAISFYFLLFNFDDFSNVITKFLGYFSPIFMGFAIAFIVNMLMNQYKKVFNLLKVKNSKLVNTLSMILGYLTLIILLVFITSVVLPQFINSIIQILSQLPGMIQSNIYKLQDSEWFGKVAIKVEEFLQTIEFNNLVNSALNWVRNYGASIFADTFNFVQMLFNGIFDMVLSISLSVYILTGRKRLSRNTKKVVYSVFPESVADKIVYIARLLYRNIYNFFTGQIFEAILLGVFVFVGITLIGSPYALMIGVTSSILNIIPYVGALLGAVIGIVLILINNPTQGLIYAIYILIVQQIDGNYIYPKLVGDKMGIPSFWIIVAITLGGAMMGITGMIFFVPLISTIYILTKEFTNKKLKEKNIDIDNK